MDLSKIAQSEQVLLYGGREERREELRKLIMMGVAEADDKTLEEYVKTDRSLLYDFASKAMFASPVIGQVTRARIASVCQKNWDLIEEILNRPAEVREWLKAQGKGRILYTRAGTEWLNNNMKQIYRFLLALSWDVRCAVCGQEIDPFKPFVAAQSKTTGKEQYLHGRCFKKMVVLAKR